MQKFLVFFVFFFTALNGPPTAASEEAQALGIGEQASISVDPGTRYSVGNSQVIQVKEIGRAHV